MIYHTPNPMMFLRQVGWRPSKEWIYMTIRARRTVGFAEDIDESDLEFLRDLCEFYACSDTLMVVRKMIKKRDERNHVLVVIAVRPRAFRRRERRVAINHIFKGARTHKARLEY